MNPMSNESAGLNLPPPVVEQSVPKNTVPEGLNAAPEMPVGQAETGRLNPASGGAYAVPLPIPPASSGFQTASTNDVTLTTNSVVPSTADDGDLIEKEWVNKAKQIVENTRDDPHQQSQELTGVKIDYLQKRYNKTLKPSE